MFSPPKLHVMFTFKQAVHTKPIYLPYKQKIIAKHVFS